MERGMCPPNSIQKLTRPHLTVTAFLIAALFAVPVYAQKPPAFDFDAFAPEVEAWMRDNLDDDALHILKQVDRDRVRDFFRNLNKSLGNDNVYDLAPLKDTASYLQPLLEQFETTRPYASWLKTHLDYLD